MLSAIVVHGGAECWVASACRSRASITIVFWSAAKPEIYGKRATDVCDYKASHHKLSIASIHQRMPRTFPVSYWRVISPNHAENKLIANDFWPGVVALASLRPCKASFSATCHISKLMSRYVYPGWSRQAWEPRCGYCWRGYIAFGGGLWPS